MNLTKGETKIHVKEHSVLVVIGNVVIIQNDSQAHAVMHKHKRNPYKSIIDEENQNIEKIITNWPQELFLFLSLRSFLSTEVENQTSNL